MLNWRIVFFLMKLGLCEDDEGVGMVLNDGFGVKNNCIVITNESLIVARREGRARNQIRDHFQKIRSILGKIFDKLKIDILIQVHDYRSDEKKSSCNFVSRLIQSWKFVGKWKVHWKKNWRKLNCWNSFLASKLDGLPKYRFLTRH